MIKLIGLMIGAYIITRMVETINNKDTIGIVAIFAFITIFVVIASFAGLLLSGAQLTSALNGLPNSR